jgi:hypothetical protein
MKKVIKLTESELTNLVRRIINEDMEETEESFDFTHTDKKLFDEFITLKNGFEYVESKGGMEVYVLKRRGFSIVLGVKPSNDPSKVSLMIYIKLPLGKSINYLSEVLGKSGIELKMNDYNRIVKFLQGAVDFAKAQDDYDNLPPLK